MKQCISDEQGCLTEVETDLNRSQLGNLIKFAPQLLELTKRAVIKIPDQATDRWLIYVLDEIITKIQNA